MKGKGRTSRHAFVSADARAALADYLEHERPTDAGTGSAALFLSAASIGSRRPDGRLSPRSVNLICEQIGRWHDGEQPDPARHISPLRPHDLRHSFGFALAAETGHDPLRAATPPGPPVPAVHRPLHQPTRGHRSRLHRTTMTDWQGTGPPPQQQRGA